MPELSEKIHDNLSRFFFIVGVITNILFYITPPPLNVIFRFISVGGNYGGYLFWLTSASASTDQSVPLNKWYAFTSIKNQHRLTAILGAIATTLMLIGIFFPVIFFISFWLFALSNFVWTLAMYHKKKHPGLEDPTCTPESSQNYFYYVLLTTFASVTTAIAATLMFCFPLSAVMILLLSIAVNVIIILGSFIFLVDSLTPSKPDETFSISTSHNTMNLYFDEKMNQRPLLTNFHDPETTYSNKFLNNREQLNITEDIEVTINQQFNELK